MSWDHLLDFARRHHLPLIISDQHAEQPVVVLTLDEYERLLVSAEGTKQTKSSTVLPEPSVIPLAMPTKSSAASESTQLRESVDVVTQEDVRTDLLEKKNLATLIEKGSDSDEKIGDLEIEERFYLEPLDEVI